MGKILILTFLTFFVLYTSAAQTQIPPDKEQLLKGESKDEIIIAENNGYVSPQKVLELKEQLGLTRDQVRKITEMMTNHPISLTVKGQEIVEAEEDLNNLFASGNVSEKMLRVKLERIGKLRADLKFIHLQIYIKVRQILSANQINRLEEIRSSENK